MGASRKLVAGLALGAALAAGALTGCSKASPEEFKAELIKAGMSEKDATCIEAEMKAKNIEIPRYSEMSAEQSNKLSEVTASCVIKGAGLDPGSVTIPSVTTP